MNNFDGTPILLSGEVPRDADVLALLETFRPGLDALMTEVVGVTKVILKWPFPNFSKLLLPVVDYMLFTARKYL